MAGIKLIPLLFRAKIIIQKETKMENVKLGLYGVAGIVGLGLLTWGGIYVNGFFNAEREAQRTNVLKESQAYTDGMRTQLNNLYLEYQKADSAGKVGIANATRDMFASVDTADYPDYLQTFLYQVGAR
jgi:hypothetical protein